MESPQLASPQGWRPGCLLIGVTIVLLVVLVVWIENLHFITKVGNPDELVPPAPAVVAAVLFGVLLYGLHRGSKHFWHIRPASFFLYVAILTAAPVAGVGLMQRFLILLTVLPYRASETNRMDRFLGYIPSWLSPNSAEAVTGFYEGGPLPWSAWVLPMIAWTGFFMLLFFTWFCLAAMLRKQWVQRERLVFPLADLPIRLFTDTEEPALWRSGAFWVGMCLSGLIISMQIINHYVQLIPDFALSVDFATGFKQRPWSVMRETPGLYFGLSFTVLAVAFVAKQEINFSIWFWFLVIKAVQLMVSSAGYTDIFPSTGHQVSMSFGGYIAIAAITLWTARRWLADVIRQACGWAEQERWCDEALPARVAWWGFVAGAIGIMGFCLAAGMSWRLALIVCGLTLVLALTAARIRAESGAPAVWILPWAGITWFGTITTTFGLKCFDAQDIILMCLFGFLTIGSFPVLCATQLEALKLADGLGMRRTSMTWALHLGCGVGIVTAFITCLILFYRHGANALADYEVNTLWVNNICGAASIFFKPAEAPFGGVHIGVGAALVLALVALRYIWLRSPFHPLGLVLIMTYGGRSMLGGVILAWVIKHFVLRLGGVRVFAALVPLFVGMAVGELGAMGCWYFITFFFVGDSYVPG